MVILIFISLLANDCVFAQEDPIQKDSTRLYENIENYSNQNKFTKFAYRLFFKPVESGLTKIKKSKRKIQKPYSTFEGKIIRNINIKTLDPFGNSIGDTITSSLNFFTRAGNSLHRQSNASTIRNLLLIRKNQVFDALLATESERLVRSMSYVTDVSFYVETVPGSPDSVDITIRELDKWSLIPDGSIAPTRISFGLENLIFWVWVMNSKTTLCGIIQTVIMPIKQNILCQIFATPILIRHYNTVLTKTETLLKA